MKGDISINVNGRVVGTVRGDTLYKTIHGERHFLRYPPAIAFDFVTLETAERAGAQYVQVKDADSGKLYRASVQTIRRKGMFVNRGHGDQIALALKDWSVNGAPVGEQLVLFGGVL